MKIKYVFEYKGGVFTHFLVISQKLTFPTLAVVLTNKPCVRYTLPSLPACPDTSGRSANDVVISL